VIRRLGAIVFKEFLHIVRDWQTLMIVLLLPVVMLFLYGYALNMEPAEVPVTVIDPSHSAAAARIAASFDASPFFAVRPNTGVSGDPALLMRRNYVRAVVRFPPDFEERLRSGGRGGSVQLLIDGSDPNTATILTTAMEGLIKKIILEEAGTVVVPPILMESSILYNPESKSALFIVPGLMAVILLMISALLTSLTLTREKETGTIEQLLVSPLRPAEIIIGKIIPYSLIAAADGVLIMLIGHFVFGVRCAGSYPELAAFSLLYIVVALSIGLVFSTMAANQQQAMMMVLPATMLPTIILSGFVFPLAGLPWPLRLVSKIVPATWYLEIIRGVILKGIGFSRLHQPVAVLGVMAFFLVIVAIKRFRERL
jgi:ABC-2 type transport system permease protein